MYKNTIIMSNTDIRKHSKESKVMAITPKVALEARSSPAEVFLRTAVWRLALLTLSWFWMASDCFMMASELFMTVERFLANSMTTFGHMHGQVRSLKPTLSTSVDCLKENSYFVLIWWAWISNKVHKKC